MFIGVLLLALVQPFALAVLRGMLLAIPLMILMGWAHDVIPAVPAWGWWQCALAIMILGILIPTSTQVKSD